MLFQIAVLVIKYVYRDGGFSARNFYARNIINKKSAGSSTTFIYTNYLAFSLSRCWYFNTTLHKDTGLHSHSIM